MREAAFELASLDYFTALSDGKLYDTRVLDSLLKLPGSNLVKKCHEQQFEIKNTNKVASPRTWDRELKSKILKVIKSELDINPIISLKLMLNSKGEVISVSGH